MVEKEKDIVSRLHWWVANRNFSPVLDKTLIEAADKIERLRKALQFALDNSDNYHGDDWGPKARAALGQERGEGKLTPNQLHAIAYDSEMD